MSSIFVDLESVGVKTYVDTSTGAGKEDWKDTKSPSIDAGGTAAVRFMEEFDSPLFLKKLPLHTYLPAVGSMYCINDAEHRAKGEHCPWCQEVANGLNSKMESLVKVSGLDPANYKYNKLFVEDCQKQVGLGQKTFFKLKTATVEADAKILNVPAEKIPLLKLLVEIKDIENLKAKAFSFVPVFDHRVRGFRILEVTNGLFNILNTNFVSQGIKLTDTDIIIKKAAFGPNWWSALKQPAEPLHADVMKTYIETKDKFAEYYKRFLSIKDYTVVTAAYQKYLTKKNSKATDTDAAKTDTAQPTSTPTIPVVKVESKEAPVAAKATTGTDDDWNF